VRGVDCKGEIGGGKENENVREGRGKEWRSWRVEGGRNLGDGGDWVVRVGEGEGDWLRSRMEGKNSAGIEDER